MPFAKARRLYGVALRLSFVCHSQRKLRAFALKNYSEFLYSAVGTDSGRSSNALQRVIARSTFRNNFN